MPPTQPSTSTLAGEHSDPIEISCPDIGDDEEFIFRLIATYSGPFTTGHETSACWIWDNDSECLVQHGDEEYNYTK